MNDLKTITVNRQLAGHHLKTKKQRELAQIGMKYEQLLANEENTLALAKEWANTLYKQVEISLFFLFSLLPVLGFGAIYSNLPTLFMILALFNVVIILMLIHSSKKPSLLKKVVVIALIVLIYFFRVIQ
ncbi:hypothetical protein [Shouchella sp. 1P01AA]